MRQVLKYRTSVGEWKVAIAAPSTESAFIAGGILVRLAPEFEEGDRLYDSENSETVIVVSGPHAEYFPVTKRRKTVSLVRIEACYLDAPRAILKRGQP